MKHYYLNERTENGVETLSRHDSIEEAEYALNELETATEIDTFEEEEETVEMEVFANTGDYYISTRPSASYKNEQSSDEEDEIEECEECENIEEAGFSC